MTTIAPESKRATARGCPYFLRRYVEALKEARLRDKVKIIVGGGTITQGFDEGVEDNAGQRIRS